MVQKEGKTRSKRYRKKVRVRVEVRKRYPVERGEGLGVQKALESMVEGQARAEEENPHTADQGGDVAQVAVAVAERETER